MQPEQSGSGAERHIHGQPDARHAATDWPHREEMIGRCIAGYITRNSPFQGSAESLMTEAMESPAGVGIGRRGDGFIGDVLVY